MTQSDASLLPGSCVLIVLARGNIHNETLYWALVDELGVAPDCLRVTYYDLPEDRPDPVLPAGLTYIRWSDVLEGNGPPTASVVLQSLHPANAAALSQLVARTGLGYDTVHILITDNEVDLWNGHVRKHGSLQAGHTAGIDAAVLDALARIDRFICLRMPYGDMLEQLLGRPLEISDNMLIRRLVPTPDVYAALAGPVGRDIARLQNKAGHLNVMLLTKPTGLARMRPYLYDLVRMSLRGQTPRPVNVYVWERRKKWPLRDMLEYQLILAVLSALRLLHQMRGKPVVRLRNLPALSRAEYMITLLRCHAIIGQARSGGGALNEALKWQKTVMLPEGSFNDLVRRKALGLRVMNRSRNAFSEIAAVHETLASAAHSEAPAYQQMRAKMRDHFWAFGIAGLRQAPGRDETGRL